MADKDTATATAETKDTTTAAAPTPESANGAPAEAPAKKGGANAWFSRALGKKKDAAAGAAPPPGMAKSKAKATTPPPPGMKASSGAAPTPATAASTSTAAHAALLRDRFLSVLTAGLLGHPVTVRQTDGTTFEAVFHTFTPFASKSSSSKDKAKGERNNVYVFKAARIIDGDAAKFENGSTVVVPASKVAYVLAKSVPNAATGAPTDSEHGGSNAEGGFRTDTDISRTGAGKDRDLVAAGGDWTSPPPGGRGGGLEDAPPGAGRGYSGPGPVAAAARQGAAQSTSSRADAMMGKGGPGGPSRAASAPTSGNAPNVNTAGLSEKDTIGKWDQFAANEQLFNVRATYDENLYTTALDKSSVGAHKQREAARLAREIEGQTTSNIHLAEERGQKVEGDYGELDEEDKYSGVLTSGGKVRAALAKGGGGDKKGEKKDARKDAKEKAAAAAPKAKMSWAAMAGAGKAAAPAPPQAAAPATKKEEGGAKKEKDAAAPTAAKPVEEAKKEETKGEAAAEKKAEEKEPAKKAPTKLSASAKAFTFNPGATTFTPGGGGGMGAGGVPGAGGMGGGPPMPMPGQPMYMQHPQGELGLVMVLPLFEFVLDSAGSIC